jgi:Rrf2 family protein
MLALTKKTEYALIALTCLAQSGGRWLSAREIGEQYGIPLPLLMNILKTLTQRGLVRSVRGARGGYVLATPASEVSLEKIILAVEGPVCLTQCIAERDGAPRGSCEVRPACPVRLPVRSINAKLRQLLGQVTLAQLVEEPSLCPAAAAMAAEAS